MTRESQRSAVRLVVYQASSRLRWPSNVQPIIGRCAPTSAPSHTRRTTSLASLPGLKRPIAGEVLRTTPRRSRLQAHEDAEITRHRTGYGSPWGDTRNMPTRAASSAASSIGCSSPQTLPQFGSSKPRTINSVRGPAPNRFSHTLPAPPGLSWATSASASSGIGSSAVRKRRLRSPVPSARTKNMPARSGPLIRSFRSWTCTCYARAFPGVRPGDRVSATSDADTTACAVQVVLEADPRARWA
jgi:hypothetical protein